MRVGATESPAPVLHTMDKQEAQLVERAKSDPAAFGALYDRYVDRVYNYIYHRVGDDVDAEDLTARTFQRSLVALRDYRDRGAPFSAWLYRIAHNVVANWHRDRLRRETVPLDGLQDESDGPGDLLLVRTLTTETVRRAVRELDPDRQLLLILKFNQGRSNAEIAAVMGRSEGAVKSLYHRTLLMLRERLADEVPPHGPGTGPEAGPIGRKVTHERPNSTR
jgi:RNA polymerase sigma-70 factor, ECF subfamily